MTQTNDTTTLCECGCGLPAPISSYTSEPRGYVKGQARRFRKGHHRRKSGVDYLVEDRGYTTPCWTWQRDTTRNGYGMTWDATQQRVRPAHVIFYELQHGPVPGGLECDHLCRNRNCVNPDHIQPVTPSINVRRSAKAKLTAEQVAEIRSTPITHGSQSALARKFGVTVQCVHNALRKKTWVAD